MWLGHSCQRMPVPVRHIVSTMTRFPPHEYHLNHYPSIAYLAAYGLPFHFSYEGRTHMQLIITFMAVVAGLVFSVAVALLVEEMIFGQVFRMFFTPQPVRVRAERQR